VKQQIPENGNPAPTEQHASAGAGSIGAPALIEALLWNFGLQRLELHLARLQRSAAALGFVFDEPAIRRELLVLTETLAAGTPYKVRLLLDASGGISPDASPLEGDPQQHDGQALPVVMFARPRVDSRDELLQHKTTRRQLFDTAGARADQLSLADLIFLNELGQVTEGSRNNVFIRLQGTLLTPPAEAGLLPGVYRQSILDTHKVTVRPLSPDELSAADAVFLCNSVRGWRQVSFTNRIIRLDQCHHDTAGLM
jgi:para-aminobenzoate synthetase/4-amino-4-deoxychorismate lyase